MVTMCNHNPLWNKDGALIANRAKQTDRCKEYFVEMLSNKSLQEDDASESPEEHQQMQQHIDEAPPSFKDVKRVIAKLKKSKSAGKNVLSTEIIRSGYAQENK